MKRLFKPLLLTVITSICFSFNINFSTAKAETKSVKAEYLYDFNTKTEIYAYNENERLPIASMTKIMLLSLVYDNVNAGNLSLDEEVIVSETASGMGGSQVFLESGRAYKARDLVKSVIVASANDASVALAERLYGSEEECVNKMNEKVSKLGLENTLFSNCTGLPKPMQYSSAKDITMIFANLIENEDYFNYSKIWLDKIDHSKNSTELANTNKLIKHYKGCDGGKTGFTNESGFCLTATAKRGNMRLISAVIGASDSKTRFNSVSTMFNMGFNGYENKAVLDKDIPLDIPVRVSGGKNASIEVAPEKDFFVLSKKGEKVCVDFEYNFNSVCAPISKGDKVGSVTVYRNGVECGKIDLISLETINKLTYFDIVFEIANKW
ncbi:MAG: D-alanyl-D-alanine carboxypeptidase [Clostridia bacterium]|nr:D-alanyl-D-alanine carboxypeptidase [Clostridia bacterium]